MRPMLEKAKAFFRHSRQILIARLYVVAGVIVGIAPMFAGVDTTPIWRRIFAFVPDDLAPLAIGAAIGLTGLLFEYLRTLTTASLDDKKEAALLNQSLAPFPNAEAKIVSEVVIVDPKDGTPLVKPPMGPG